MEFNHPIDRKQLREYIRQFEESGGNLNDLSDPINNPIMSLIANLSEKEKGEVLSMLIGEVRSKGAGDNGTTIHATQFKALESDNVDYVGNLIIWFSVISAVICVFSLGKVTSVRSDFLGMTHTSNEWSVPLIFGWVCAGLSGVLFGYLFKKIASILRWLEKCNINK